MVAQPNVAVLVTGDRHATERLWRPVIEALFWDFKLGFTNGPERIILIHGDQGRNDHGMTIGIDSIAGHIGDHRGHFQVIPMPYMGEFGRRRSGAE